MNTPITPNTPNPAILVWDLPVRMFHWLLVASFAGAWLTAESETLRLVHVTLGYTVAGLVAFRLVWGLVGTRHARFADFVRGPAAVVRYVRSLLRGQPEHHVGHNPAGALAIVALLALGAVVTACGWARYNEIGGDLIGELHEVAANLMLGIVIVHVLGVVVGSWLHRENLVRAMFTGRKAATTDQTTVRAWRPLGVLVLAAVLGFWALQWATAPTLAAADGAAPARKHHGHEHERD